MKRIIIALSIIIFEIAPSLYEDARADSVKGEQLTISLNDAVSYDSIQIEFCYPDSNNPYVSGPMIGGPKAWEFRFSAGLDSIGGHIVRVKTWLSGISTLFKFGWNNMSDFDKYSKWVAQSLGYSADSTFQKLFPIGAIPKDSVQTWERHGTDSTLVATIIYSNTVDGSGRTITNRITKFNR
jgi:hypothetical protein